MEGEAVVALRRQLDGISREQADRLELAARRVAETEKQTAERNTEFSQKALRLAERVRADAMARNPMTPKKKPDTLALGQVEEDEEENRHFSYPVPPRAEQVAPAEPPSASPPWSAPAAQAGPQRSARPAARRPMPGDDDDEDFSQQSWLH
ncbi:hypothetical protein GCM10012275_22940 [Longimycelium tulufanense]|uniref:Uncharacterized protein n=1 Tax=Longimycelium tulufanense TaxID=907463 RepID=A0A8J3FTR4_9PSEU|nr:hypothetical protein [Longimycelium tulufanense]GGM51460.1 hypothetical protein GCM10012275_22940 [Longimycelium tulufanense]